MNPTLVSVLALAGLALPVLHLHAFQDRARGREAGEQQGGGAIDPDLAARAATYFRVADYDGNGWISFREAQDSLGVDRRRFSVYDANRDGRITLEEFTGVFVSTVEKLGAFPPPIPNPDDPNAPSLGELLAEAEAEASGEALEPPAERAKSVQELFGKKVARGVDERGRPQPNRIPGPVPSFRRLDYDADGGISHADLVVLLRGSGLVVRLNTLIASLDLNQDGVIDEAEFLGSMSSSAN